jgi:predicted nucleic acid-binding protein
MCLVIDINVLHCVFGRTHKNHKDFKPVLDWIDKGKGKMIYGGTKYKEEFARCTKDFIDVLNAFNAKGKIVKLPDDKVEEAQKEVMRRRENLKISDKAFNDEHIVAIVIVSKCRVVCSADSTSFKYVKDKRFYPENANPPKLYTKEKNKNLLNESAIVEVCRQILKR